MGTRALPVDPVGPAAGVPTLVERLRRVHQKMVDAALVGDGFDRMAELAAEEAERPVAIVVPALAVAVVWPGGDAEAMKALERFAAARVADEPAVFPDGLDLVVPVVYSGQVIGAVGMLGGDSAAPDDSGEFLHLAATAAATAFALEEARERDSHTGGVVEGVLRGTLDTRVAARRAAAAGCDLAAGLSATVTELR